MKNLIALLLCSVSLLGYTQAPVIIDTQADSSSWGDLKETDAKERLKNKLYKDSIEYYRILAASKPKMQTPDIMFTCDFELDLVKIIIWEDQKIVVDTIINKGKVEFGPFEAEHFFDISCSKSEYVTKKVFISTVGAKDVAKTTTIDITPSMIEAYKFKKLHKSNPFDKPAAKVLPSVDGLLNYDLEYIKERKAVIDAAYKKKYRPTEQ
jgi:hypothetical protein